MVQSIGRILSLMIAMGYVVFMIVMEQGLTGAVFCGCIFLLLPLGLIWSGGAIGSVTGSRVSFHGSSTVVDKPTPPILMQLLGWLILLGLPVLVYFVKAGKLVLTF